MAVPEREGGVYEWNFRARPIMQVSKERTFETTFWSGFEPSK